MQLDIANEVYSLMKEYVPAEDLEDAAGDVVNHLIDMGYTPSQIEIACSEHDEICDAVKEQDTTLQVSEDYMDDEYADTDYSEGFAGYTYDDME
jgi:cytosine/adenosine deaminase-related metal-dependent hydrolase